MKNALTRSIFELEKCSFFFKWVRISPEIDSYHHQCCFPDKMSYNPTFLVKIDIFTDRTFCSPTLQRKFSEFSPLTLQALQPILKYFLDPPPGFKNRSPNFDVQEKSIISKLLMNPFKKSELINIVEKKSIIESDRYGCLIPCLF